MWLSWIAYWWISARDVKPTLVREPNLSRLSHIIPLVLAALLLSTPSISVSVLNDRFIPRAPWSFAIGVTLTAAGLLFTVWARRYLGPNWSGTVTIKEGHELITTGPYAIVRHPIYSGLLLAFAGSAVAIGEWRAILAVVLALLAFLHKLRIEEWWMERQFGSAYRAYCRRVPALIPLIF
jgi:protein-S-isoprenylcysteine O-methyltransferase Ste14